MNAEVQAALVAVVRAAIDNNVSLDTLVKAISVEYSNTQRGSSSKPPKRVVRGSLVNYWHAKFGTLTAHVLEVSGERLRLRLHRGAANEDVDVPDAPFSAKPQKDHWSFRP